jgi:hypothetical protein
MIKYFIHLSNPIVAEAFEASRKLHLENKRFWYRNITEVIDYFGRRLTSNTYLQNLT